MEYSGRESGEDSEEEEREVEVLLGYRYWHCWGYRQECLVLEGRERARLRVSGDEEGESHGML